MISCCEEWDECFFKKFSELTSSFSFDALKRIFSLSSPFSKNNHWKAWIYEDAEGVKGRLVASYRPDLPDSYVALGFFECLVPSGAGITASLLQVAESWAKDLGRVELRGPIDGSVFHRSRFLLSATRPARIFEPQHPAEYVTFFRAYGFRECTRFRTFQVPAFYGLSRMRPRPASVQIKRVDISRWSELLHLFHPVIMTAYSSLSDFIPCTEEEFVFWQEGLAPLIDSRLSFIMEENGEPFAFALFIKDPSTRIPIFIHLGKIKQRKQVTAIFMTELLKNHFPRWWDSVELALVAETSPVLGFMKYFKRLFIREVAEYATFSKRVT